MSGTNGKKALHVATFSGWYRFEQNGKQFTQTKRALSYWTLTCMTVDAKDPKTIYAGTEHSGLFFTKDAGAHWNRAEPQVPKMFLYSALAIDGGVMVGTDPLGGVPQQKRRLGGTRGRAVAQRRRQFSA